MSNIQNNNNNNKNNINKLDELNPFKYYEIRDWNEFFDYSRFAYKADETSRRERIEYNLHYYRANYFYLFCFIACFNILFYPQLYLFFTFYVIFGIYNYKTRPSQGKQTLGLPILNIVIYLLFGGIALIRVFNRYSYISCAIALLYIIIHSSRRKRTFKNKATNMIKNIITNIYLKNQAKSNQTNNNNIKQQK